MAAHARLGPSDSSRWLNCPGSINFTRHYANESSAAADEGTVAHWVREQCLELGFDSYDFLGTRMTLNGVTWEVDDEMAEALVEGIDLIREVDGPMFVEKRLDLGRWMPGQFGTLDCGIAGKDVILISDLKYGRGVAVSAVKNTQQMIYALGFWDNIARHVTDAQRFRIVIDQPRNAAGGGEWEVSLGDLLAFGETLKEKASATLDENAPLCASKAACTWCPAANMPGRQGGCPAHAKWQLDQIELDFEDLDEAAASGTPWTPPPVEGLTPERLVQISLAKSGLEKFLEYAHAKALQHIMDYGPTGGQKVVLGRRPPQKWRNADAAEAFMCQQLPSANPFNKKMKTPTQAAAEMGKKYEIPAALVERGQPKPIMVPVEDARPSIMTLESEFGEQD